MLSSKSYRLRIELYNDINNISYIEYGKFRIGSESDFYKINLQDFSSVEAADYLYFHNDMSFSTYDWENDQDYTNCASEYNGGWWFKSCYRFCLTCESSIGQCRPITAASANDYIFYTNIKMLIMPNF